MSLTTTEQIIISIAVLVWVGFMLWNASRKFEARRRAVIEECRKLGIDIDERT